MTGGFSTGHAEIHFVKQAPHQSATHLKPPWHVTWEHNFDVSQVSDGRFAGHFVVVRNVCADKINWIYII